MKATEMKACLERELGKRKGVYPNLVKNGQMSRAQMEKEIREMAAILEFVKKQCEAEIPSLPGMDKRNISCPSCGCKMLV
jgi:hypothetical protein